MSFDNGRTTRAKAANDMTDRSTKSNQFRYRLVTVLRRSFKTFCLLMTLHLVICSVKTTFTQADDEDGIQTPRAPSP